MIGIPESRPILYLEMDDAGASKPVLKCYGEAWIDIGQPYDTVLMCKLRGPEKIVWAGKSRTTDTIAIMGSRKNSISRIEEYWSLAVTVFLPKSENPRCIADLEGISRGAVYHSLPTVCLVQLGYGPG